MTSHSNFIYIARIGSILNPSTRKDPEPPTNPLQSSHICCALLVEIAWTQRFLQGASFITLGGEKAVVGSHVIFYHATHSNVVISFVSHTLLLIMFFLQNIISQISEILLTSEEPRIVKYIALWLFSFKDTLHPLVQLPVLELTDEEVMINGFQVIFFSSGRQPAYFQLQYT